MKQILLLLFVTLATDVSAAPKAESSIIPTSAPSSIQLHDQFDAPQKLSFPATDVTLLTIADKKGSEHIKSKPRSLRCANSKRHYQQERGLFHESTFDYSLS
ncbi:MAG: hypothetical protein ABSE16_20850 [Verrucomicrobiota bacterium]|jgi:hypothetical protein